MSVQQRVERLGGEHRCLLLLLSAAEMSNCAVMLPAVWKVNGSSNNQTISIQFCFNGATPVAAEVQFKSSTASSILTLLWMQYTPVTPPPTVFVPPTACTC